MNETIELITKRRSIRKYQQQQISDNELEQILYAASFSPSAGNRQNTQIIVCQDADLNKKLGEINRSTFQKRTATLENSVSKAQPSIADDPSIKSAFYDAPTVITLFSPKQFLYGQADCFAMANSIALAACALGIGSCILGRAEETFASELGIKLQAEWGIQNTYEAKVHISLGFLQGDIPKASPRKYPKPIIVK